MKIRKVNLNLKDVLHCTIMMAFFEVYSHIFPRWYVSPCYYVSQCWFTLSNWKVLAYYVFLTLDHNGS